MNEIYDLLVHVGPLPGADLLDEVPAAKGAFVGCVVPATDERDATEKLRTSLLQDHYELKEVDEIHEFAKVTWEDDEVETQSKAMAWDAYSQDLIGYGPFHAYS